MNHTKYLDSSIQILKGMLADKSNELESEQRRALTTAIRKLRGLAKQPKIDREVLYRAIDAIAEQIYKVM